jgi:hypothetical protein
LTIREEDWPKVEKLVRRLLELDEERMEVVRQCEADLERGVELTMPIMEAHKATVALLREIMDG